MNITRERKEIISSFERKSSLESLAQSIPEWPSPSRVRNLSFTHDGYIRHTATERIILMTDISVIYGTQRVKVWKRLLKIQDLLKTLRPACEPWSSTKWRLMISMTVTWKLPWRAKLRVTCTFTACKPVDFKVELFHWLPEIAKFSSTSWTRKN